MSAGRPLRFLILVTGGWICVRAVMLWPVDMHGRGEELAQPTMAVAAPAPIARPSPPRPPLPVPIAFWPARTTGTPHQPAGRTAPVSAARSGPPKPFLPDAQTDSPAVTPGTIPGLPPPGFFIRPNDWGPRLGGSAWSVFRRGSTGLSPELGGSQAGVRLTYALRPDRRLALAGRIAMPIGPGLREAAMGLEWQPTHLPIRIVAEQRVALNRGRGGPSLMLIGGVGPRPLGDGFDLESYVQAGVIARSGGEAFADGATRLAHPIAMFGKMRIDLGIGTWGAAQRGARRLDIGVSLGGRMPLAGQGIRISLDWRQRVGGNAAPDSGPALTIGTDF